MDAPPPVHDDPSDEEVREFVLGTLAYFGVPVDDEALDGIHRLMDQGIREVYFMQGILAWDRMRRFFPWLTAAPFAVSPWRTIEDATLAAYATAAHYGLEAPLD